MEEEVSLTLFARDRCVIDTSFVLHQLILHPMATS